MLTINCITQQPSSVPTELSCNPLLKMNEQLHTEYLTNIYECISTRFAAAMDGQKHITSESIQEDSKSPIEHHAPLQHSVLV